jgi:hypothetical protein
VLLASGMIVGESLVGVLLAALVVFSGQSAPLALVGDSFGPYALWLGGLVFVLVVVSLQAWLKKINEEK